MYDELISELRLESVNMHYEKADCELFAKAADAIERLSKKREAACWGCKCEKMESTRWISVKERLPDEHIRVLVVNDDAKFMVAERAEDDWWYQYCAYDVDRWDALEQGVITHWMPLPEPPKEEEIS